ncbi:MAG: DUF2191 domain-containing protein [Chloroflexi bacterium]|nr:DUF2191 domain-containing protein [Chloroflexota bacterium]
MKTTVELSDALLARAREVAAREHRTLRSLLEEGLGAALDRRAQAGRFVLRDARFGAGGTTEEFADWDLQRMLTDSYEGRGT